MREHSRCGSMVIHGFVGLHESYHECSLVFAGGLVLWGVLLGAVLAGVLRSSSVGAGGFFGVVDWSCDVPCSAVLEVLLVTVVLGESGSVFWCIIYEYISITRGGSLACWYMMYICPSILCCEQGCKIGSCLCLLNHHAFITHAISRVKECLSNNH